MKLGTLTRRTPLRANPEAYREWQDRTREKARAKARGARGSRTSHLSPEQKARKRAEFVRCFGSKERRAWINAGGCCIPGCTTGEVVQNAHVGSHVESGMGRRGDADTVAGLCLTHHRMQEGRTAAFEREMDLPAGFLLAAAARLDAEWAEVASATARSAR